MNGEVRFAEFDLLDVLGREPSLFRELRLRPSSRPSKLTYTASDLSDSLISSHGHLDLAQLCSFPGNSQ